MTLKIISPRNKKWLLNISKMYRYLPIILLVFIIFINTCNSFPNSGIINDSENEFDIFYQRQYNNHPSLSKRILKWTSSKIEDGVQNIKYMWNNLKNNIRRPILQRRTQYTGLSSRQPEPLWRSFISKAWNFVTGFFQKSERYFAKRRMDTDRQGIVPAFIPAAPVWAMPLAMVGVAVLLRDPINMISNGIACKYCIYKIYNQFNSKLYFIW